MRHRRRLCLLLALLGVAAALPSDGYHPPQLQTGKIDGNAANVTKGANLTNGGPAPYKVPTPEQVLKQLKVGKARPVDPKVAQAIKQSNDKKSIDLVKKVMASVLAKGSGSSKSPKSSPELYRPVALSGASIAQVMKTCDVRIKALPWPHFEAAAAFLEKAAQSSNVSQIDSTYQTWQRLTLEKDAKAKESYKIYNDTIHLWQKNSSIEHAECSTMRMLAEDTILLKVAPSLTRLKSALKIKMFKAVRTLPLSKLVKKDVPLSEIPAIESLQVPTSDLFIDAKTFAERIAKNSKALPPKAVLKWKSPPTIHKSKNLLVPKDKLKKVDKPLSVDSWKKNTKVDLAELAKKLPKPADILRASYNFSLDNRESWSFADFIDAERGGYAAAKTKSDQKKPRFKSHFAAPREAAKVVRSSSRTRPLNPVMAELWTSEKARVWNVNCPQDCAPQYAQFGPKSKTIARIEALSKTSALDGVFLDHHRNVLAQVLHEDALRANLETAKKISETILNHDPIKATVRLLLTRIRHFLDWVNTQLPIHFPADNNHNNWNGEGFYPYVFYTHSPRFPSRVNPYDKSGLTDPQNQLLNELIWTGETGPVAADTYLEIENRGNTREMLSLLYRTLYNRGHNGHGLFDMIYRTLIHAVNAGPVLQQTVLNELNHANIQLSLHRVAAYVNDRYNDICYPDVNGPAWGPNSLEMPPRGWGFLKYQCAGLDGFGRLQSLHNFLAVPYPVSKSTEFSYSTTISPRLSTREVAWTYKDWSVRAMDLVGNPYEFVQYEGSFVPWRCGGDVRLSHDPMPADHLGATLPYSYPQWCRGNLQRALGGPSKSTDLNLIPAYLFGFTVEEMYKLRAALAAWMEQGQDHSFHEVMASAEAYGMPYVALHQANDNWDEVFTNLLIDGNTNADYGQADLWFDYFLDHIDQDCTTADFLRQERIDLRALQIAALHGLAVPLALPALHYCGGIPNMDIRPEMLPATNIYTYSVMLVHCQEADQQYYLLMSFSGGNRYFSYALSDMTHNDYETQNHNQLILFPHWTLAEFQEAVTAAGGSGWTALDVANSALTYTQPRLSARTEHCFEFREGMGDIHLCTHNAALAGELLFSANHIKNLASHDPSFGGHQAMMKEFFGSSLGQDRGPEPPHSDNFHVYANARQWICGLNPNKPDGNPKLHANHILFLQFSTRCGQASVIGPRNGDRERSMEFCTSEAFRHHSYPCAFLNAGDACPTPGDPITQGAYIRELAHRTAVCMYTFMETIGDALGGGLTNDVLRDSFIDPVTKAWMPEYKNAAIFSGFAGGFPFTIDDLLSRPTGSPIPLGFTSFSRDIHVAWGYPKDTKIKLDNLGNRVYLDHEPSGMFILVDSPPNRARQLRNSALIYDNQAEVLVYPARYTILHKRTYFSEEFRDGFNGDPWTYSATHGLFLEVFIQFDGWL